MISTTTTCDELRESDGIEAAEPEPGETSHKGGEGYFICGDKPSEHSEPQTGERIKE